MHIIRIWSKLVLLILLMLVTALAILCIMPFSLKFVRQNIRLFWANSVLCIVGIKLEIIGAEYLTQLQNKMIIANHISWLDTVILLKLQFMQFIGKIEMLQWPILRIIIQAGGTIFVDRNNKKTILSINKTITNLLTSGATIGLFPEGRTSDGLQLLPLKSAFLEAALRAKSHICPIVISYIKHDKTKALEVSFANSDLLECVKKTLSLSKLTVKITILPLIAAENFTNRDQLSALLAKQLNETYINSFL
jgi:1-acyl-sn-glycerol-3-phosphate acyltransferase